MRESRLYGFVRGALSNERPYRVSYCCTCSRRFMALRDILRTRSDCVAFGGIADIK
jgi:hypothetical protein